MERKEQFDWAISVAVKAYFDDTLAHSQCAACMVGNLIADKNGYAIVPSGDLYDGGNVIISYGWYKGVVEVIDYWRHVHTLGEMTNYYDPYDSDCIKGKEQLESTGYTIGETMRIEAAFEKCGYEDAEDPMYHSLMTVVDELIDIHKGTEKDREEAKLMFEKS